jgi:hypothetical protein
MQHGQNTDAASDPRAIGRQRLDGGRGFVEQRGIDQFLVRVGEGAQLLREGEGEEVVVAREHPRS